MRPATLILLAISALTALVGASVGGSDGGAEAVSGGVAREQAARAAKPPKLKLIRSSYGRVLADRRGQALYAFTKDGDQSRCYGRCANAWPPYRVRREPRAGGALDEEKIGLVERRRGRDQVTYDGQPLYFYAHEGRNEVLCHDVDEFGGTWLALKRSGRPAD